MSDKPKQMKDLPTHLMKIADLIPADYNPRQLTEKQFNDIKASISKFGFIDPVIVNQHPDRKNIIVGGHQRCRVAADLGYKEVPTVFVNLSLEEEKELNVRHNKNTGDWDFDILANQFEMPDLINWGFEEADFGGFGSFGDDDDEDEDTAPRGSGEVQCPKCGEIFNAAKHRL